MSFPIVWADGFDNYNSQTDLATEYYSVSAVGVTGAAFVAGRTDGKAVRLSTFGSSSLGKNVPSSGTLGVSCAIYPVTVASPVGNLTEYLSVADGVSGLALAKLGINNATGVMTVVTQNGTYTQPAPLIPIANWTYVEFYLVINASAGSFYVKINNNLIFSQTGINTTGASGSVTTANQANFNVVSGADYYVDDLLITTGGTNGDCRLQTDFPISNESVQFTPLMGANWQEVSETAMDGDTSYNSSSTVGNTDLFNFSPLSVPAGSIILDCFLRVAVAKTDAGTRAIETKMVSNSNSANGASFSPSTSYEYQQDSFGTFLSGLGLLTQAGINGTYSGYTISG